jgi:hypothetical protein
MVNEVELAGMASERAGTGIARIGNTELGDADGAWLRQGLHDLCQPLTALECVLFVNREPVAGESLEAGLLRTVMDEALVECGRMMVLVRGLQERMAVKTVRHEEKE